MELQKLEKIHVLRVQQIAKLTWPDTFKEILSAAQIKYMLDWMYNLETLKQQLEEGQLFYMLTHNDIDIGFIGVQNDFPVTGETKLHKIYVLPSSQGLGAGKILMNKAEQIAIENKSNYFVLNVNRCNKATDFYMKLGFEITYEENIDIGNGFLMEDFVMKKSLPK